MEKEKFSSVCSYSSWLAVYIFLKYLNPSFNCHFIQVNKTSSITHYLY